MGGDNGKKGGRVFRNNYKGHMDKTKGVWKKGRKVGWLWWGGSRGGMQTTVIEKQ